jgi:hypothetical protein
MVQNDFSECDLEASDPVQAALQAKLDASILGTYGSSATHANNEDTIDEDESSPEVTISNLASGTAEKKRLAKKPDVDHLKPGTITTDEGDIVPLFGPGDKIIVERNCSFLEGTPWLDTVIYRVVAIDDESGLITCLNDELGHNSAVSFKSPHQKVFLCPLKGNPFTEGAKKLMAKESAKEKTPITGNIAVVKSGGRGRPKGTKNRPKAEIQAEKKAKMEIKKQKQAKKMKR